MVILCNGMPRSASTWSFNVAICLLRRCFPNEPLHSGYDENLARFLSLAPAGTSHVILKSHTLDAVGKSLAQTGAAKVIYTWRDVADAIVSCCNMFGADFDSHLATMRLSLDLYRFHRDTGNAIVISYEEIMGFPDKAVGRVGRYLGLEVLTPDIIRGVSQQTSFERMRDKVRHIEATSEQERLVPAGNSAYDPETLLHRGHIRDGSSGYGRRSLTAEQLDRIDALMREYELTSGAVR